MGREKKENRKEREKKWDRPSSGVWGFNSATTRAQIRQNYERCKHHNKTQMGTTYFMNLDKINTKNNIKASMETKIENGTKGRKCGIWNL